MRTRAVLKMFDGYLSVGTRSRQYLRHFGAPEPLIFDSPHCVDNAAFAAGADCLGTGGAWQQARQEMGAGPGDFLVLFAGKFVALKRPIDVIEAAARLGSDVVVAMAGNGPLMDATREAAKRLNVRVTWCGFLNQTAMPRALAAADCVAVPSETESWGLIVNEALAAGTPCVVSSGVACAADLVRANASGAVYQLGDIDGLAASLRQVRAAARGGVITADTCRRAVSSFSFERATDGVVAAAKRTAARRRTRQTANAGHPRVLAALGNMVSVFGLERMSFEVLRSLRDQGAAVHCVVNGWESGRVVDLADDIGASWSTGYYYYALRRRAALRERLLAGWDVLRTSVDLVVDARRFRPTHIFVPEFSAVLRSGPALWLLRRLGVRVVLRLGNPPEPGRFYRSLWKGLINPCVDQYVANSYFTERELRAHGIDAAKMRVVYNTVPNRPQPWQPAQPVPGRVIFIGQIIPPKGVDVLLEAVAHLRRSGVDVTLDVVGDIEGWEPEEFSGYRARVRRRAETPDLTGAVRFLGVREDIPVLLSTASVHCLPSRAEQKEGFGVVVLEAKRAGVPSVVTKSGAVPEILRHGVDGWICRDFSAEAIAEGLLYFLSDPARARQAGAAARAAERDFSHDRFSREWNEVFSLPAEVTSAAAARPI
jgi:glycosyltransferase involved in cell wall biosynthesis